LTFDEVTDKNKLAPFYGPRCMLTFALSSKKNYFCLDRVFSWSLAFSLALTLKTTGLGLVHAVLEPIPVTVYNVPA